MKQDVVDRYLDLPDKMRNWSKIYLSTSLTESDQRVNLGNDPHVGPNDKLDLNKNKKRGQKQPHTHNCERMRVVAF